MFFNIKFFRGFNMYQWIKNHKILFVIICFVIVAALVGVPLIINLLFKYDFHISIFQAEWTAGDALEYYGAVLSFLGTVVLGILALYQTYIIKSEADAKAAILEEQERKGNMPHFYIRFLLASGFCGNLKFSINNISNNIAYNIEVYNIKTENDEGTIWESSDTFSSPGINPQKDIVIQTKSPAVNDKKDVFLVANMSCKDKYGAKHEYLLKIICQHPNKYFEESIIEI